MNTFEVLKYSTDKTVMRSGGGGGGGGGGETYFTACIATLKNK